LTTGAPPGGKHQRSRLVLAFSQLPQERLLLSNQSMMPWSWAIKPWNKIRSENGTRNLFSSPYRKKLLSDLDHAVFDRKAVVRIEDTFSAPAHCMHAVVACVTCMACYRFLNC
jgi:hypothetical protein